MADFGPVVDQVRVTSQRSARTGSIVRFVWHHQASVDDDSTITMMVTGSREVSATYTVSNDNPDGRGWSRITGVVPEQYRAWTSDSQYVDGRALTVECANSSGGPEWGIADESFEACARLAAYAYSAYGVPLRRITSAADGSGHIGHGELIDVFGEGYATFCPGNLDIDRILARAAQLVGVDLSVPAAARSRRGRASFTGSAVTAFDGSFALPSGHFYGAINGPKTSHGGVDDNEQAAILMIQQRLQELGFAPNVPGWADGKFEQPTTDAVAAWQSVNMAGLTRFPGRIFGDDWAKLFGPNNLRARGARVTAQNVPTRGGRRGAAIAKPPWPLPLGTDDHLGDINGSGRSHGGNRGANAAEIIAAIRYVQQRMIQLGFVPGVSDPNNGWADGLFEQPTINAVTAWQHATLRAATTKFGEVWPDDYERL
ncbi:MAG: hypothetical protein JWN61_1187 [Pseudonocardiales bacterium]|nr:hypothetical protein [Pseudonocardiales bacterium]